MKCLQVFLKLGWIPKRVFPSWKCTRLASVETPEQGWKCSTYLGGCNDFQGHCSACELLFFKLGSRNQLGFFPLYQSPCCIATSQPKLLDFNPGLAVEFSRLMVLEDFNLPSLGVRSESAWEFLATLTAVGPSQII